MSFYALVKAVLEFEDINEKEKKEVISRFSGLLPLGYVDSKLEYVDDNKASFREEGMFSYIYINDLRSILEELKADGKIKRAKLKMWYLEEPDEEYII